MYRVMIKNVDVSTYVISLNWRDSVDTLGVELTLEVIRNREDKNLEFLNKFTLGDAVQILNKKGESILQCVIVAESPSNKTITFTAYDMAWYLNKSTVIKQFKKLSGNDCIKALCDEVNIDVEVDGLDAQIDKIYKDKKISEVIQDIISQCSQHNGKRFFIEFEKGKLKVAPFKKIEVTGSYEIHKNLSIDIFQNINSLSLNKSIVDMKNAVLVISGDKDAVRVTGTEKDEKSIEKYGLLQEVIKLDEKDYKKAEQVAKNELKKLNKVTQEFTIEILGDDKVKSGRVITLNLPNYELQGDFFIKESTHTIQNGIHKASLNLEEFIDE